MQASRHNLARMALHDNAYLFVLATIQSFLYSEHILMVLLADFTTIVCLKHKICLWEYVKVSIIGAGNGGCATAVDLTLKGFDTTLCSAYAPNHILPLINKGGLEYSGRLGEGFVNLRATIDIKQAVEDA
jgi:hypothetical protein